MLPKVQEMRPDVPVIMITAYGDPETKRKAIEGGATGLADQAHRLRLASGGDRDAAETGQLTFRSPAAPVTNSGIGRYCCKSRKSNNPKNLAKVGL